MEFLSTFVALLVSFFSSMTHVPEKPDDPPPTRTTATVAEVIDGDTIDVRYEGSRVRIRYIGIDAPEYHYDTGVHECYAEEATAANRSLLAGSHISFAVGKEATDKYGRTLAYVYAGDTFVNEALLLEGYATALPIPPNITHARAFYAREQEAVQKEVGLWRACRK